MRSGRGKERAVHVIFLFMILLAPAAMSRTLDTSTPLAPKMMRGTERVQRTLVIYVFHDSNEWYRENLKFFIRVALGEHDGKDVDYIFVINGETELDVEKLLWKTRARKSGRTLVLSRENTCLDGGTIGVVLSKYPGIQTRYRYFVLINSSVRGPFLPRYLQTLYPKRLSWTAIMTGMLNRDVKLVGTTVSCQGQVHVQSMVLATDRIGISLLMDKEVFKCTHTPSEAVRTYELQASSAILDAG